MIDEGKLVDIIRAKGPCLPATVAKEVKSSIMITSAILSDLAHRKKVFLSQLKVGSSPLYYVEGQQARLMQWADQLSEKDRRTYDLIKEQKVLRASVCDPLTRFSLAKIKDFATPLVVTANDQKETFYKWYLSTNEEATAHISKILNIGEAVSQEKQEPAPQPAVQPVSEPVQEEQPPAPHQTTSEPASLSYSPEPIQAEMETTTYPPVEQPGPEASITQDIGQPELPDLEAETVEVQVDTQQIDKEEPITIPTTPEKKQEISQQTNQETTQEINQEEVITPREPEVLKETVEESPQEPIDEDKNTLVKEAKKLPTIEETSEDTLEEELPLQDEQETLTKTQERASLQDLNDPLYPAILEVFGEKNIEIQSAQVVRKGRELDLLVEVPSVVGRLRYFCKVLHKKRSNDKDLSAAFIEGELKKLPLLFLYTGELTKKGKELSQRKELRNLMVLKVDYGS